MGQEPSEIREEIEETRDRMTETVEALGYKADVPERTKERLRSVGDRLSGASSDVSSRMSSSADRGAEMARSNPMGLGIAGLAAGLLLGAVMPRTRVEDEKLGPAADRVKDAAKEVGRDALDRGVNVAKDAASAAADVVRTEGQEHAQEVSQHAQEQVQQVRETS